MIVIKYIICNQFLKCVTFKKFIDKFVITVNELEFILFDKLNIVALYL